MSDIYAFFILRRANFEARLIPVYNLTLLKFELLLPTELARFIGQEINCLIPYIPNARTHMPGVASRLIAAIALCVLLNWLKFSQESRCVPLSPDSYFGKQRGFYAISSVKVLENTQIRKNREGPEMKMQRVNACLFDAIRHPCSLLFHDSSYFLLPSRSERARGEGKRRRFRSFFPSSSPPFLCARYLFSLSLPPAGPC